MKTVSDLLEEADRLINQKDFAGAAALLRPVALERKDAPTALLLKLAEAQMKSKQTTNALQFLDRAYRQEPNNPDCLFLYGRALVNCSLLDRALPLLNMALGASPDSYKVHWALADYYTLAERSDLAIPHLEKALQNTADPNQKTILTLMLGTAHKNLNNIEMAKDYFKSVTEPEELRANAAISAFSLYSDGPESPRGLELRNIAQNSKDSENRTSALLELAKAHDRLENYDQAFELCRQAWEGKPVKVHNASATRAKNDTRKRIFTPALYAATKKKSSNDEQIVLICGMPRTGTTLLQQILGAHSRVATFGETTRFVRLADDFLKNVGMMPEPQSVIEASANRGDFLIRAKENLKFLHSVNGADWDIAVEKTPMNYEAAGYMHLVHRGARFVFCHRHPADSFISSYQNQLRTFHDYAMHQESYVERFMEKENLCDYWKKCFPEQILDVKYEELALQPEVTVRSILEFIGLTWEDETMRFFERKSTVRTLTTHQVRQSFYSSSVDRWKNYEKHLAPLFNKLESEGFTYR